MTQKDKAVTPKANPTTPKKTPSTAKTKSETTKTTAATNKNKSSTVKTMSAKPKTAASALEATPATPKTIKEDIVHPDVNIKPKIKSKKNGFNEWLYSHQGPSAFIFALIALSAVSLVSLLLFSPAASEVGAGGEIIEVPETRQPESLTPDSIFASGWISETNNPAHSGVLPGDSNIVFTPDFWGLNDESKTVRDEWLNVSVATNNAITENKVRASGSLLSVYNYAYSIRELITDVNTVVMGDLNLNYEVETVCNFTGQTVSLDGPDASYAQDSFTPLANDILTYFVDWDRDENYTADIFFAGWAVISDDSGVKGLMSVAYNDEWQELIVAYAEVNNNVVDRVIKFVLPGKDTDGVFVNPEMLLTSTDSLKNIVEFMVGHSVAKMNAGDAFQSDIFYTEGSIWDINNGFKYTVVKTYTDYSYDLSEPYFYGLTYERITALDKFRELFNDETRTLVYNLDDDLLYSITSSEDGSQHELYDLDGNPTSYSCTSVNAN